MTIISVACSKENEEVIEVTSIELDKTSVTLLTGESVELVAAISPSNATNKDIEWVSSDSKVATVADGKVTAVSVGKASITAKSYNGLSDTCRIITINNPDAGESEGTGEVEW